MTFAKRRISQNVSLSLSDAYLCCIEKCQCRPCLTEPPDSEKFADAKKQLHAFLTFALDGRDHPTARVRASIVQTIGCRIGLRDYMDALTLLLSFLVHGKDNSKIILIVISHT
jgi:hypothetical protein